MSVENTKQTINRCDWASSSQEEMHYHDNEWGVPEHDDAKIFEMLV